MKKVELITLQRVPNYGSFLQAYATQEIIKMLGYDIEIINYFPERMSKKGLLKSLKNKKKILKKSFLARTVAKMIMLPSYNKRFNTFNKFIFNKLNMTKIEYHNDDDFMKNTPIADIYITGSDQVWNSGWNGGIDKPLFLNFVPKGSKCIAYAASFGKSSLEDWEIPETKELLNKYSKLSTREISGTEILNSLGFKSDVVLDPTLLLNKDDWSNIISDKYKDKKYILVYNLNRNKKIDIYANNISKSTGLPIYYLSYSIHEFYKKGKMICCPQVEDFLSLINNASYIVTDSFHATAFSINFNKNFMIVFPNKYSTRVESILKITNLTNRIVKDVNSTSLASENIDFKTANEIILKERKKSIEWLKNALK